MNRLGFAFLMCLVCLGCQSRPAQYWFDPDKTLEEIAADCRECNRQAHAGTQEEHILRYLDSVEHDKPWQMDNDLIEDANRDLDEKNLFEGCMTGKGYHQVRDLPLGTKIRTRDCFGGDTLQHLAGR